MTVLQNILIYQILRKNGIRTDAYKMQSTITLPR